MTRPHTDTAAITHHRGPRSRWDVLLEGFRREGLRCGVTRTSTGSGDASPTAIIVHGTDVIITELHYPDGDPVGWVTAASDGGIIGPLADPDDMVDAVVDAITEQGRRPAPARARIVRRNYDKPWRCPAWSGPGFRAYWWEKELPDCPSESHSRWIDATPDWRWRMHRCPACGIRTLPLVTRAIDPDWLWLRASFTLKWALRDLLDAARQQVRRVAGRRRR